MYFAINFFTIAPEMPSGSSRGMSISLAEYTIISRIIPFSQSQSTKIFSPNLCCFDGMYCSKLSRPLDNTNDSSITNFCFGL